MHTDDDKKKGKKKKEEVNQVQDNFYSGYNDDNNESVDNNEFNDFYNEQNYNDNNTYEEPKSNNIVKIIVIIVLVLILGVLIYILLGGKNPFDRKSPEIVVSSDVPSDTWTNKDVVINVQSGENSDIESIKYTINCENNCPYVDISNNQILISNDGVSKVVVIATGKNKVETKKEYIIKIDRQSPTVVLSPNQTKFTSKTDVTVCAVCTDSVSGCKEERVCKTYNKSISGEKLTVEDNAGNKVTTSAFSVTIDNGNNDKPTVTPTCSLSVNEKGVVTAKYSNANYYGFSSDYKGKNETSKTLSMKLSGQTEKVTYYVKNTSSGKTNTCSINVKYSCTCKLRGDDGKCYKTFVKQITDPKSSECANATRKTNNACDFYKDEGMYCSYSKN